MKDNRVPPFLWNEAKGRYNIMLTPSLVDLIDQAAEEVSLVRSEMIERLIRGLSGDPSRTGGLTNQEMVKRLVDEVRWADGLPRRGGDNQSYRKAIVPAEEADGKGDEEE